MSRPWKPTRFSALLFVATLSAQQSTSRTAPVFEVVSIHAVPLDAPVVMREQSFTPVSPAGQYVNSRDSLTNMICFAFACKYPDRELIGLPNWAKSQSYAVAAKPEEGLAPLEPAENLKRVRLMMHSMLADRFQLRLHSETRQEGIYQLQPSRSGVKLKEVAPPVPPAREGNVGAAVQHDGGIRMVAVKVTMSGFARALDILTGRKVVDQTGLNGYYDFDVKWNGPEQSGERTPEVQFGGPELIGLLISNLQTQFGLRLLNATGPVEYWIVDNVQPPSAN